MRSIIPIALVLLATGSAACQLDFPSDPPERRFAPVQWRRTVDGWEKVTVRSNQVLILSDSFPAFSSTTQQAHPHPIVVSLLIAMVSTLALVGSSPHKVLEN